MEKFLLISISIAVLQSSNSAYEGSYCKRKGAFKICGHSEILTFVRQEDLSCNNLSLENFTTIAPYTFRNVTVEGLSLGSTRNYCFPNDVELVPEALDGLPVLRRLSLRCLKFKVKPNPFGSLKTLVNLRLDNVAFEKFPQDFFADFPRLQRLTLESFGLTNISSRMFSEINRKLKRLRIRDKIEVIEAKSFERFRHLLHLELPRNRLNNVQSDMFDGLDILRYLDLANNSIRVLRNSTFTKVQKLNFLYLESNKISEIEPNTFSFLKRLKELNLAYNYLESIPKELFRNLRSLHHLDLRFNKISIITSRMFEGCSKLQHLELVNNQILWIEPKAFSGLRLHSLNLTNNNLTVLGYHSFHGLHVHDVLHLRHITRIHRKAFSNLTAHRVSICHHLSEESARLSWGVTRLIEILSSDCGT